jgi:hypothetical protein
VVGISGEEDGTSVSMCAGRVAVISGAGRGLGRCHAVAPVACTRMTSDLVTDPRAVDEPAPEQVSPVVTWLAGDPDGAVRCVPPWRRAS